MLRTLYNWTMALAGHRNALVALAVVSFLESWIFPIPPDVMLIPMVIARPDRALLIAGVCLASSVAGGLAGYAIGAYVFDEFGLPLIEFFNLSDGYTELAASYHEYGFWAVFVAGLTPVPYKIITILSGALGLSLPLFIGASIVARGTPVLHHCSAPSGIWRFSTEISRAASRHGHNSCLCGVVHYPADCEDNLMLLTRHLPLLTIAGSGALLVAALAFQYVGGLAPCELCNWQRWPHLAAIILGLAYVLQGNRLFGILAAASLFAGSGIALFHVGVEQAMVGRAECLFGDRPWRHDRQAIAGHDRCRHYRTLR